MTHDEMIEAVARAMYERRNASPTCYRWDDSGLDDEHPGTRDRYIRDARAAIRVIAPAVLEEAAAECDKWADQYRQAHKNAQARKQRQEARDFESMAMSSAFRAHEIRAMKTRYEQ